MQKPFIFRHYWDEQDAEAKIEPSWLNANDNQLTSSQLKIKELVRELTSPLKYIKYSENSSGNDKFNKYYIYYKCEKKDDADSTNNRKVTNITFCISKEPIDINIIDWKISENYIFKKNNYKYIIFMIVIILIFLLLLTSSKESDVDSRVTKVLIDKSINNIDSTNVICETTLLDIINKKESDYCFENYIKERCQDKIDISYNQWLATTEYKDVNLECKLIESEKNDISLHDFIKSQSENDKRKINQFFKDFQAISNSETEINNYSVLIDQWNEAVIKNNLNDKYLLPRDENNNVIIKKLNSLLSIYTKNESSIEVCNIRRESSKIYLPLQDYCALFSNKINNNIRLTKGMNEEDVILSIKSITKHLYINSEMLMEIAYLNDFEFYFNQNLYKFHQNGFSKNIKTYIQFQEIISEIK
jgi:hypothetical protein